MLYSYKEQKSVCQFTNNLEYFRNILIYPLDPGSIVHFYGSVPVNNIMEKLVSGFSWHVHYTSGMTQEMINHTVARPTRRFHGIPSRQGSAPVGNITVKWVNGFSWHYKDKSAMTQATIWNILRMFNLLDIGLIFLLSEPGFVGRWILMKFSGYGHNNFFSDWMRRRFALSGRFLFPPYYGLIDSTRNSFEHATGLISIHGRARYQPIREYIRYITLSPLTDTLLSQI